MINNQNESVSFYSFCLALYFCATSIVYTFLFWISRSSTNSSDSNQELKKEYLFVPIAIETLGSWGQVGLKFIKELGKMIKDKSGEKRSTQYLFQRSSMAVQRGNSASILGSVSSSRQLDEVFYL